jgi:HEAT repeat protein
MTSDDAHALPRKRRVRWTLLALLWVWAILIFLMVDLFFNVDEFDAIRPRAEVYRATRYAAHQMVGEPYVDDDFGSPEASIVPTGALAAAKSEEAQRLEAAMEEVQRLAAEGSRDELERVAREADDPRIRILALRALADLGGAEARPVLLRAIERVDETDPVRKQAARFVGRTGEGAFEALEEIRGTAQSEAARAGAVLGLGELGSERAAERALELATDEEGDLRAAALKALARMTTEEAAPVLIRAVGDFGRSEEARAASCRALGVGKRVEAVEVLTGVLSRSENPPSVRASAARSLGIIGRTEALAAVEAATRDPDPDVSRQARMARSRLKHLEER